MRVADNEDAPWGTLDADYARNTRRSTRKRSAIYQEEKDHFDAMRRASRLPDLETMAMTQSFTAARASDVVPDDAHVTDAVTEPSPAVTRTEGVEDMAEGAAPPSPQAQTTREDDLYVGTIVEHRAHGVGKVVDIGCSDRGRHFMVTFESGDSHVYYLHSLHKLKLAPATTTFEMHSAKSPARPPAAGMPASRPKLLRQSLSMKSLLSVSLPEHLQPSALTSAPTMTSPPRISGAPREPLEASGPDRFDRPLGLSEVGEDELEQLQTCITLRQEQEAAEAEAMRLARTAKLREKERCAMACLAASEDFAAEVAARARAAHLHRPSCSSSDGRVGGANSGHPRGGGRELGASGRHGCGCEGDADDTVAEGIGRFVNGMSARVFDAASRAVRGALPPVDCCARPSGPAGGVGIFAPRARGRGSANRSMDASMQDYNSTQHTLRQYAVAVEEGGWLHEAIRARSRAEGA